MGELSRMRGEDASTPVSSASLHDGLCWPIDGIAQNYSKERMSASREHRISPNATARVAALNVQTRSRPCMQRARLPFCPSADHPAFLLHSRLRARFTDPSQLPQSKPLEAARLSTFGKWWPHDKKKGWLPTSKSVRRHLTPLLVAFALSLF